MPILVWGWRKRPPTKMGLTYLRLINFDNHPIFKIHKQLLLHWIYLELSLGCDQTSPYHHRNHIKIESPNIMLLHTRTLQILNRCRACLTHLRLLRQLQESILDAFKVVLRVRAAAGAGGNEFLQIIMPRCGSIQQAETCQIFSIAGNPRWSRVWQ